MTPPPAWPGADSPEPDPVDATPATSAAGRAFAELLVGVRTGPTPVFDWIGLAPGSRLRGPGDRRGTRHHRGGAARPDGDGRPVAERGAGPVTVDPLAREPGFVSSATLRDRRHRRRALRRQRLCEHDRPRDRRRRRHPLGQPVPPLRLEGVDDRGPAPRLPRAHRRAVPRRPERRGTAESTLRTLACTPRSAGTHDRSRRGVGDARRVQRARAFPRFAFLREAVEETERLWVGVLAAGMRAGDFVPDVPAATRCTGSCGTRSG